MMGEVEEGPELDNNMIIAHFLSTSYIPGAVQSALHTSSAVNLRDTRGVSTVISPTLQGRKQRPTQVSSPPLALQLVAEIWTQVV